MNDSFLTRDEIDALLGKKGQRGSSPSALKGTAEAVAEEGALPNLELILDFPLVLSVRLGQVQKTIQEIRKICPGTVVELESSIRDQIEIFVSDKLIARGEVVIIEEHFGIKITQIINPLERIKQLR